MALLETGRDNLISLPKNYKNGGFEIKINQSGLVILQKRIKNRCNAFSTQCRAIFPRCNAFPLHTTIDFLGINRLFLDENCCFVIAKALKNDESDDEIRELKNFFCEKPHFHDAMPYFHDAMPYFHDAMPFFHDAVPSSLDAVAYFYNAEQLKE